MKYVVILIVLILAGGCRAHEKKPVPADVYYTCSMHPQVVAVKPGTCPICHMDLIPVTKGSQSLPNEIELSDAQVQLGNIHVDTLGHSTQNNGLVLNGTINFDENMVHAVSARVMGRIERLYHKTLGEYVEKGSKLFELYSEELNNAKQEYLLLLEKRKGLESTVVDFEQLRRSARSKLFLWGMSEPQIKTLEQTKKSTSTTTFYSTAGGYITSLDVTEGDYVQQGGLIVHLANTGHVWAEVQVYTSQLALFDREAHIKVQVPDLGWEVEGKMDLVIPEIDPRTRINLVRVSVENPGNRLKPGMPVYIVMSKNSTSTLTLPSDAVIRNPTAQVWVLIGKNKFRLQQVITGSENGNQIEIVQGLKPGDVVVTSGTYLLNSEFLLRNAGHSMEGMDMRGL